MASNTSSDADLAALREDLASLRQDLSSLMSNLRSEAAKGVSRTANRLDDNVNALYRSALDSGEQSARQIGRQVEEHPLLTVLLVLGFGYIGGRMMSR